MKCATSGFPHASQDAGSNAPEVVSRKLVAFLFARKLVDGRAATGAFLLVVVVVDSVDFSDLASSAGAPCSPGRSGPPPVAPGGPWVVVVSLHPTPGDPSGLW
jgi:hypothetical protein